MHLQEGMVERPRLDTSSARKLLGASEPSVLEPVEFSQQRVSRSLVQESPEITAVRSAAELLQAVEAGAQHIEIRKHLDLTGISPRQNLDPGPVLLGEVPLSLQSIRVCPGLPPDQQLSTPVFLQLSACSRFPPPFRAVRQTCSSSSSLCWCTFVSTTYESRPTHLTSSCIPRDNMRGT